VIPKYGDIVRYRTPAGYVPALVTADDRSLPTGAPALSSQKHVHLLVCEPDGGGTYAAENVGPGTAVGDWRVLPDSRPYDAEPGPEE
jgi:hypothetical protein